MGGRAIVVAASAAAAAVALAVLYRRRRARAQADDHSVDAGYEVADATSAASKQRSEQPSGASQAGAKPAQAGSQPPAQAWDEAKRAKERGNKRFSGRQYDQAIKDYTRAIELAPEPRDEQVSVFYCNRAACHSMLEDYAACVRDCDAALDINPTYVKALNRRGTAREKAGDCAGALLDYTASCLLKCFEQQPTVEAADRVLKMLGRKRAEERVASGAPRTLPSPVFIRTFFDSFVGHRALLSPANGAKPDVAKAEAARRACDPAASPAQHATLLEEEAIALMHAQRYTDALAAWEAALAAWGKAGGGGGGGGGAGAGARADGRRTHNMLGTLYHVRGSLDEALEQYGKALALEKKSVNVLLKRGSLYFEREQFERCLADMDGARAAARGEERADCGCHRGQVFMLRGELQRAVEELRGALAVDKSVMLTYVQLAMSLYRLGLRTDAAETFREAEGAFPESAEVFNFHGEILLESGDMEGALGKFEEAIRVGGHYLAAAYVNKANALLVQSQGQAIDEAMTLLAHALEADPLSEAALIHSAQLKWQRSDLKGAIECYDRAIALLRTKEELGEAFSMREAAAAHLALCEAAPDIYIPAMERARQRQAQVAQQAAQR